jgi:hypothetical protein
MRGARSMPWKLRSTFAFLVTLAQLGCTVEKGSDKQVITNHEAIASELLRKRFTEIEKIENYLNEQNVNYLIEKDNIAKQYPKDKSIAWRDSDDLYILVLIPNESKKIYRFRIYLVKGRVIHIEEYSGYKNPYQ